METQAKYADTIYSRDSRGLYVNLFIPSEVTWADAGITLRQVTGIPDEAATRIEVTAGQAATAIRVRIPSWAASPPRAWLNGTEIRHSATPGSWLAVGRHWQEGDRLEVSLPMRVTPHPMTPRCRP